MLQQTNLRANFAPHFSAVSNECDDDDDDDDQSNT